MRFIRMMILIAIGGLLVLGCGDEREPFAPDLVIVQQPDPDLPQLEFLRWNGAAPLQTLSASFWPVRGQASMLEIHFQGGGGRFLLLLINSETLRLRPDGTPIALGDSIEIRATVDPLRMMVTLDPPGLVFNPAQPAYMELSYDGAAPGYLARESEIGLWRQETAGESWYPVRTTRLEAIRQAQANLHGFTRYALAIGR